MNKFWRLVAQILPRKVVYFAAIRLWAYATGGKHGLTNAHALTLHDALTQWEAQEQAEAEREA